MSQIDYMDETDTRGYANVEGDICLSHITEPFILADLQPQTEDGKCQICSAVSSTANPVVEFEAVQSIVMELITSHYQPERDSGATWDGQRYGPEVYEPRDIAYDFCADVFQSDVEEEIIELLIEAFVVDQWTTSDAESLEAAQFGWEQFVSDVRFESRFVFLRESALEDVGAPHRSAAFLWSLLPYVDEQRLSLVTDVPADTAFYRGRLVKDRWSTLTGAKALGPAPAEKASPNRMSPEGVPMFYGSATPETAIREIASHGTLEFARIGAFRNRRNLKVLDLTKLPVLPNLFDKSQRSTHGVARFFKQFTQNVTEPIRPDGRAHLHYIPTQVVTEFFRWVPKTKIDGIKLPSAQDQSETFVLFLTADHVSDFENVELDGAPKIGISAGIEKSKKPFINLMELPVVTPALTLKSEEVHTYKVIRHIEVERVEPGTTSFN